MADGEEIGHVLEEIEELRCELNAMISKDPRCVNDPRVLELSARIDALISRFMRLKVDVSDS